MKPENMMDEHEVKSACETLLRAEEIKGNAELMKKVHAEMSKKKKHITSVSDLRKKADEMAEASEDESEAPAVEVEIEMPEKKKKA